MSNKVVLGLGGNEGDVEQNLKKAHELISKFIGKIVLESSIYRTKAWGVESQPDFLNQNIQVKTELSPAQVLVLCLKIEKKLGRVRLEKWHSRIIDIDILFYEDQIIKMENLIVPHPYIQDRNFVLDPLIEILPNYLHPVFKKTVLMLKKECKDQLLTSKK